MGLETTLRTCGCGEVAAAHLDLEVFLCGWVHSRRDHGGVVFFDLRDRSGLVQCVASPAEAAAFEAASSLRSEFVVRITGRVSPRPKGTENPHLPTGAMEVRASRIEVLNACDNLPFEVASQATVSEEARLKYRYLDLRRPRMQRNMMARHEMNRVIREHLDKRGFVDVETPILTKSTPEGARDFLVPSRLAPGHFYALPQSPQLFKQILMVAGIERYYQIARCFRDEDLRADRQLEFTQLDLEMSFVGEEDVMGLIEGLVADVLRTAFGVEVKAPFPRIDYDEAMRRYGSDKPDTRIPFEIKDLSEVFKGTGFKVFRQAVDGTDGRRGAVRAVHVGAPGFSPSRSELDDLAKYAAQFGAKGLAWVKWEEAGPTSPIVKFFSADELTGLKESLGAGPGQWTLFAADETPVVEKVLGALRLELVRRWPALAPGTKGSWNLLWVDKFPLFGWSVEEGRWVSMHHPFTSPSPASIEILEQAFKEAGHKDSILRDPGNRLIAGMRARAYDLVLNGNEIGGGSIRIHRPELQQKVFSLLGIGPEQAQARFGFLLDALKFGAPPHGGIALGLDRIIALLCGEDSIREVIAFPKTAKGTDPMTDAPSTVDARQLKELHIQTAVKHPPK